MTSTDPAAKPERVRGMDAAFIHNETRSTPWHIVGVLVLDPSTAPDGFDAAVLRRVISERLENVEAFRRRIVDVRGALSVPHWVVDPTVDVTRHVRRASVPGFEGLAALARLAAQTAEVPLPRDRPLWQIEVLENMGDGHVGVVAKVHHSVMDGAAAVGVLGALFDLEPTPRSVTRCCVRIRRDRTASGSGKRCARWRTSRSRWRARPRISRALRGGSCARSATPADTSRSRCRRPAHRSTARSRRHGPSR